MIVQYLKDSNTRRQEPLLGLNEQEEEIKYNSKKEGEVSGEVAS